MNQMLGLIEVDADAQSGVGLEEGAWDDNTVDQLFGALTGRIDPLAARCRGGLVLQATSSMTADVRQMARELEGQLAELVERIANDCDGRRKLN